MITIQQQTFSVDHPLIVAEVAQAHDGSLGLAHAFIAAVAPSGADAVKFQTHIATAESTPAEQFRKRFNSQDQSRFAYWQRTAFTEPQWQELKRHADDVGLLFLSSPFSLEAVDLLERLDLCAWKVASGEVGNTPLITRIASTGRPVLLSSGMSPWSELDAAVKQIQSAGVPLAVLQCTSSYPCPPEAVGLNLLDELRSRYEVDVGLSDHSGTIFPGLAAATIGISVLELHVTLSRDAFSPDQDSSVTVAELTQLVRGVRFIASMRSNPVDKDATAASLAPMRALFTRSIVARRSLEAGAVLNADDVIMKKPGGGLPASRLEDILGRRLRRSVERDELIMDADLA